MTPAVLIALCLAVPFAAVALIVMSEPRPNQREGVTLVAAASLFFVVWQLFGAFEAAQANAASPSLVLHVIDVMPGLPIAFEVEPLGMMFALIASVLWIINSLYSIGYMRGNKEKQQTRFYACFAVSIGSTMGIAFAGNMFTLFLFYELLTLSTYPLVAHKGDENAKRGARTYVLILLGTSIGFQLLGLVWTYAAVGTLDFRAGGILAGKVEGPMLALLLALYMFGIGKAALMPFHAWLPAAMVAPTPVSALLHAVAVVKAGVFSVVKVVVYIFGIDLLAATPSAAWLGYLAGFSILTASVIALRQDNLKRRLAFSTVSQLSYVTLGAAILAPISVLGAAMHIAAHAFGKITLFFAAGSIYTAAHKTEISQLNGIGWKMPYTMSAFAIGSLSMIGLPPTIGFMSKWYILSGAVSASNVFAIVVIVVSTLLNAAYFLPIVYRAFFMRPDLVSDPAAHDDHGEAPWPIVVALCLTAAATIVLFFLPDIPLQLAELLALQNDKPR